MLSVAVKANVLLAMSTPMDDDSQSDLADVLASAGAAFTKHWDAVDSIHEELQDIIDALQSMPSVAADVDRAIDKLHDEVLSTLAKVAVDSLNLLRAARSTAKRAAAAVIKAAATAGRERLRYQSKRGREVLPQFQARLAALQQQVEQAQARLDADDAFTAPLVALHPDRDVHEAQLLFDRSEVAHALARCATCSQMRLVAGVVGSDDLPAPESAECAVTWRKHQWRACQP